MAPTASPRHQHFLVMQCIRSCANSQTQLLLYGVMLQLMADRRRTSCYYYLPLVRQWHCLLLSSDVFKLMQALTLAIVTGPFRSPMQPCSHCELS